MTDCISYLCVSAAAPDDVQHKQLSWQQIAWRLPAAAGAATARRSGITASSVTAGKTDRLFPAAVDSK
jgi:hypothetical protein